MTESKTRPTGESVAAYIDALEDPRRRADGRALIAMMTAIAGEEAALWGPSLIGFGRQTYAYDSGRTGEIFRIGFSPRKAHLVFYNTRAAPDADALLARLGKHKTGKGCVYVNKLADIDMDVLRALYAQSWTASAPAASGPPAAE